MSRDGIMRLFFAVHTSPGVKEAVRAAIGAFPVNNPPWRWIAPENYHLTMKFLGEVDERLLPLLGDAAGRVAARTAPFSMTYGRFGGFPSLASPRVIFFEISDGAARLGDLASLVDREMESAGFARERRPFHAHLTLARIKQPLHPGLRDALERVPPLPASVSQAVDRFVLMRSHLSRAGALYEEIGSFTLEGSL